MFKIYSYEEVDSTNTVAKKLLEKEDSVIVIANYQTGGKGRNGKSWFGEPEKNIYVSFGITTNKGETGEEITKYQMLGSLAVLKVLQKAAPRVEFTLKYPNDVIANDGFFKGKISGILCEHEFMGMLCFKTVIGIGINIHQDVFENISQNTPISLKLLKVEVSREIILKNLEKEITELLEENRENIITKWKKELKILGKKIRINGSDEEWEVNEILKDGRLKVIKNKEVKIIDNGDSIRYF